MCAQGHGNLYVLYGCRAWTRNPAAALKRSVVCDGNLLPHAQPFSCSYLVCGSLPARCCLLGWAVRGMWLRDEFILQDWPELLILAVGLGVRGIEGLIGVKKEDTAEWAPMSCCSLLNWIIYVKYIMHLFYMIAIVICIHRASVLHRMQELYLLWFYCWLE